MPGIPANMDSVFALDMAAALRQQANSLRASPNAGFETVTYKVRRGGLPGFFGATTTKSERRLKPGAQQLLDNATALEQQAAYFTTLSQSLAAMKDRETALEAQATADEQAALEIQKPVGEGGQQYTRNDMARPANNNRLAVLLGYDDRQSGGSGISINSGGTLGGLRIPTGT